MEDIVSWVLEHPFLSSILASLTAAVIILILKSIVRSIKRIIKRILKSRKSRCLLSRERFFKNLEYQYKEFPFVKSREEKSGDSGGGHRFEPLEELRGMLKQKNCSLVIVGGAGGLGKSRLCYELSGEESSVYFVDWRGYQGRNRSLCDDLAQEKLKKKILVYEDAHEQVGLFIEFYEAVKPWSKKVVVTTRYPGELAEALRKHKISTEYQLILGTLADAAVILPTTKKDWLTPEIRQQIGTIAEGIPQLAVEAFRYLKRQFEEGKDPEQSLQSIHTALQLLDTLVKDIEDKIGADHRFLAARLALIRMVPENHQLVKDPDHFEAIQRLQDLGYLRRQETVFRFTPDILADHLVVTRYFHNNRRHPQYDSLIQSISPDLITSILRTLSVLETERDHSFFTGVTNTTLQHIQTRKDLTPPDRVSIGLNAFNLFQDFQRIETNYGPFWEYGKKLKDPYKMNSLAIFLHKLGSRQAAESLLKKSQKLFEKARDNKGLAITLNNLGNLYQSKGDWDRAIEFYHKSLKASERLGVLYGVAKTLGNLGLVYKAKGDWDRALEFYQKSLELKRKLGDRHGMAQTWVGLGNLYQSKGDRDRAIEFYHKSLRVFDELGDHHGMAQTWVGLGNLYQSQKSKGDWDRAIGFYHKSLEAFKRLGDLHGMALSRGNLGLVLFKKGEHKEGVRLAFMALMEIHQIGDKSVEESFKNNMIVFIKKLGQDRFEALLKEIHDEMKDHLKNPPDS